MLVVVLFFLSFVIRLISADQSFWLDEGASVVIAKLPLGGLLDALKGDFHPPLFYLLLHYWLLILRSLGVGGPNSEWLIRLPFLIISALTMPVLYLFLEELLGPKKRVVSLAATFLLLLNPLHLYYSTELRMYSLNAFLSLLSWLYLVKWQKRINHTPSAVYYLLFSLANLYTFYGALFNLAAQWLFVWWRHKKGVRSFVICQLLLALFFLPWLPKFWTQLAGGGYIQKVLPGWSQISGSLSPKSLGLIMAKFTIGRITLVNKGAYAIFVAGISLYFLLCSYLVGLTKGGKTLLFWFFGSLIFAILVSFRAPVLGYWRYVFLIPPFVSIIALGLSNLPRGASILNLSVVFLIFVIGNLIFWTNPTFQREDWRAAAKLISKDNSLTVVNFPDVFAPLKFYAPGAYYYPNQESLGKVRADLDQSLPLVIRGKQTIFVFDYLSDLSDKKRSILPWLKQAGFVQQPTHNINGVGFIYEFKAP